MTYPNAVFSAFAFIGFVMCAIPLPWHIQAWNTGTCLYMIWTGLACLNQFINSVIWTGNAINWAPVWCDISARFMIGAAIGIPTASLCINRRLYHIACIRVVTTTKSDKRRAIMIDLAIGVGVPVLAMILQYVYQGHRFDIYEDIGCAPSIYYVWPAYPLFYIQPIIIGLISGTYAILTIIAFHQNRSQFNAMLSSGSNFTCNRFIRLMCLASVEVLFTVPVTIYGISVQAREPLNPWISWENVHSFFSRVDQFPALEWRDNGTVEFLMEGDRWSVVFCAFLFFSFFGFADEAKKNYRYVFQSVAKRVGLSTGSFGNSFNSSDFMGSDGIKSKVVSTSGKVRPIIPLFVHQEMLQRRDSLDSYNNLSIGDVGGVLNEKSSDFEKRDFCPDLSYGELSIADVGGTLADIKDDSVSSLTVPTSSAASSITYPRPTVTRQNSRDGIEVSSARRGSAHIESPESLAVPTFNSPLSRSQPTGGSMV